MTEQALIFAQISDAHFRRSTVGGAAALDDDLRNELERDLATLGEKLGAPNGIFVCGDVVFSGKKAQYEEAKRWLEKLCQRVKCPTENVWMVPGNHDVDREKLNTSRLLRDMQAQLRSSRNAHERNATITDFLKDLVGRDLLFSHIADSNEFASLFGCNFSPSSPTGRRTFPSKTVPSCACGG